MTKQIDRERLAYARLLAEVQMNKAISEYEAREYEKELARANEQSELDQLSADQSQLEEHK